MTVLITGVGAPGTRGTIYSLKRAFPEIRLIGTDIDRNASGRYLVDQFCQICAPESDEYLGMLTEVCISENVDVVLPQTTRELLPLSQFSERNLAAVTKVAVSSSEAIKIANDKLALMQAFRDEGQPTASFRMIDDWSQLTDAAYDLGYPAKPVVVKVPTSNGMRGLRILGGEYTVSLFLNEKPDSAFMPLRYFLSMMRSNEAFPRLLMMEYLPGDEYTVDCFRGEGGMISVPRKRLAIRSGITFSSEIALTSHGIVYMSRLMAEKLDLRYAFGFQFKLDEAGVPKILECNPRVQGTMVASTLAGANVIAYAIRECTDPEHNTVDLASSIEDGMRFDRYYGGTSFHNGELHVV